MEIYLTKEELEREKALFEPHKEIYKRLDGERKCQIKDFVPIDSGDSNMSLSASGSTC